MKKKKHRFYLKYLIYYDKIKEGVCYLKDPNDFLFAEGRYKTQLTEKDLEEYYIEGIIQKCPGYLCAKGVIDLYYVPNYHFKACFTYDLLFISYDKKIIPTRVNHIRWAKNFEVIISGEMILDFIIACEKYSKLDINKLMCEIKKKQIWYNKTFAKKS